MSANQEPPWTFRVKPEMEKQVGEAMTMLGWTRTKLVNEALEIALPIILQRQAEAFAKMSGGKSGVTTPETKAALRGAAEVAKRTPRA
jgi:hypothetical protein